jgi:hypothetical protein
MFLATTGLMRLVDMPEALLGVDGVILWRLLLVKALKQRRTAVLRAMELLTTT